MKKVRFTETQIISILKQQEAGMLHISIKSSFLCSWILRGKVLPSFNK